MVVTDYIVTFAPSETSQQVSVNITDDGLFELDEESFSGSLSFTPATSRVELGQQTSVAIILDNDSEGYTHTRTHMHAHTHTHTHTCTCTCKCTQTHITKIL